MMPVERVRWVDHLFGLGFAAVYLVLLMATAGDLAMSRDESFYVVAAERYAGWFELLAEDPGKALEQPVIDRYWEYNHEHPALMKSLFALSWIAYKKWELFPTDSMAHRFPGMLTGALTLWLVYLFGARVFGRWAGVFAAAALALLPRYFYHAHLNCFDVPIIFFGTLVTYCYLRSLTSRAFVVWTGVVFGLALATKHNSWILPGIFLIHYVWVLVGQRRAARVAGAPSTVSRVPWWLLSMVALGPLLFVGSWPWLWEHTWERFLWYARFHVHHVHYNMAYLGTTYFEPPMPVSYPFVMTLYTVPLATLATGLAGLVARARALLPPGLAARIWPNGQVAADELHTDTLLFGCFAAPILIIALPSTPIFGGTKHWLTAYPFLALFAGYGFSVMCGALCDRLAAMRPALERMFPMVSTGACALLLAPAAVETAHSHPFGLSHYGYVAGGVPGAADDGMNRQFWGFTTGSLVPWLKERMPQGGTVWLCDTTVYAWHMLQRDGLIPKNIRPSGSMASADYVLVHHEDHFAEVDFQAWLAYRTVRPAHVLTFDGVPIITVYENPKRR